MRPNTLKGASMMQLPRPSLPTPYRRAMVIGCPGGGKSTFSRALCAITGLPLHHLDMLYWNPDRTTVPKEIFYARQRAVIATESWIIDGNFGSTLAWRLEACDAVFFLAYPVEVCLGGIRGRLGQARSDIPWVEVQEDPVFVDYVRRFPQTERPKILNLLESYPDKTVFRFTSRDEADAYLRSLQ